MSQENSFDVVCKADLQEVDNAVTQAMREMTQRFDFRGSQSKIERQGNDLFLTSEDEFKLKSVIDILQNKLVKRGVSLQFLDFGKLEEALGGTVKQKVAVREGIDRDQAKKINGLIKDYGLRVQSQVQGDQLRVSGKSRDDLQRVIQFLKEQELGIPIQFINYR